MFQYSCGTTWSIQPSRIHLRVSAYRSSYVWTPARVSEPSGSVAMFRHTPKGLIPNATCFLVSLIRAAISETSRSVLFRRQDALSGKSAPYRAYASSSAKTCPATGYG